MPGKVTIFLFEVSEIDWPLMRKDDTFPIQSLGVRTGERNSHGKYELRQTILTNVTEKTLDAKCPFACSKHNYNKTRM